MRRSCLLLSWGALIACAGLGAGSGEANLSQSPSAKSSSHRSWRLIPARYFVDSANDPRGVHTVGAHMDRDVTLAGHYSQSVVGCGTGCISFWIVDRRTGAILGLPPGSREAEFVYEVRGRRDSDIIQVIFGSSPTHEETAHCRARSFRLRGTRFTAMGDFSRARCPR
jgi:hypothetical protein